MWILKNRTVCTNLILRITWNPNFLRDWISGSKGTPSKFPKFSLLNFFFYEKFPECGSISTIVLPIIQKVYLILIKGSKVLEWSNQELLTSLRLRSLLCLLHFCIYDFHVFFINPTSDIRLPCKNPFETSIFNIKKIWWYIKLSSSGFALSILPIRYLRTYYTFYIYTSINCCIVPLMLYFFQILYKFK